MVIRSGGLTLVFEHLTPADDYRLTNWQYVGGPAAGFSEIVAPFGIRIGDARSELDAANPDFTDYISEIEVGRRSTCATESRTTSSTGSASSTASPRALRLTRDRPPELAIGRWTAGSTELVFGRWTTGSTSGTVFGCAGS